MNRLSWWTLTAAAAAPILLVGGWTISAALQPARYDPIRDTISALAARGAPDRWVMTAALVGAGICYIVIAAGFHSARLAGRFVLVAAGVATNAVALFPQPSHGNSGAHTIAAAISLVCLATWPLAAARRDSSALLRPSVSAAATLTFLGLVAWFALDLHGGVRGLAERAATGTEALWPLAVVLTTRPSSAVVKAARRRRSR